ncbi:YfjI family protein [Nocardiopsis sp. EMB25]|uniref:YfjI family protein n=1 Tax=Nocardiopsis sp. EMB25 TaxID=2835867 RepID=UPI0022838A17|nr:YfjI family protein [Nocardiopsis sp. EMB25]MCY9786857.1 YfjI family protein [Nocardiopsis sp. EMB25]
MNNTPTTPAAVSAPLRADLDAVREFLATYYGDAPGLLHIAFKGDWTGQTFTTDWQGIQAATELIGQRDATGVEGVYARPTTLVRPLEPGKRGGADDSHTFFGFWTDVDYAGAGHKDGNLPPDEAAARRVYEAAGYPEPTILVNSGGGLYHHVVLRDPVDVSGREAREEIKELSRRWHRGLRATSEKLGWSYGSGVSDLARVLRVPGTINRKPGTNRMAVGAHSGLVYTLEEIREAIGAVEAAHPVSAQAAPQFTQPKRTSRAEGDGPFDVLARTCTWADLLTPHGWTNVGNDHGAELWLRPGDSTSKYSARAGYNGVPTLNVFSESAGLPTVEEHAGKPLTMGRLFTHLNHGGDEKAAARDLRWAALDDPRASTAARRLPRQALAEIKDNCRTRSTPPTEEEPPEDPWEGSGGSDEDFREPPGDRPRHTDVRSATLAAEDQQVIRGVFANVEDVRALPWPSPSDADTRLLPTFPVHTLPGDIGKFAEAVATFTRVPIDLVALTVLGTLPTLVGGHAMVEGHWTEKTLNLWTISILGSGGGKSPAFDAITAPVRALEKELRQAWDKDFGDREELYEIAVKTKDKIVSKLVEASGDKRKNLLADLDSAKQEMREAEPPPRPQLLVGDVLPEALGIIMKRVGGHIGLISAEGGFLGNVSGRYSKGVPNLELVLISYDSTEPYRVDRVGREAFEVERPSLSVNLAVQPVVIDDVASSKAVLDRGLLNRVLFAQPESLAGHRDPRPPKVPEYLKQSWEHAIRAAFFQVLPGGGKFDSEGEPVLSRCLFVGTEAEGLHLRWRAGIEKRINPNTGDLAVIEGWANKLPGTTYRIAALLHLLGGSELETPISELTMSHAIEIAEYAIEHALEVLGTRAGGGKGTRQEAEENVLAWLRRHKKDVVTLDEIRSGMKRRKWVQQHGADGIRTVLGRLAIQGWLASVQRFDKAGRRMPDGSFVVHPELLEERL